MTKRLVTAAVLAALLFAGGWRVLYLLHLLPTEQSTRAVAPVRNGNTGVVISFAVFVPEDAPERPVRQPPEEPLDPQEQMAAGSPPRAPAVWPTEEMAQASPPAVEMPPPISPDLVAFQDRAEIPVAPPVQAPPPDPPKRKASKVAAAKKPVKEKAVTKKRPAPSGSRGARAVAVYDGKLDFHYPGSCSHWGHEGTIELKFRIGQDGIPSNVTILRSTGCRTLDRAVCKAVLEKRFTPARKNGKPISSTVRWPIRCELTRP